MPLVTFSVTGTGTGVRQDVDVVGSGHVIRSDAYEAFGGDDEFPSPLAFEVAGDFNPTIMTTGQDGDDDSFQNVRLTATVETDASREQIEALGAEVERRCPISALFRRAGTGLTSTWTARTTASV